MQSCMARAVSLKLAAPELLPGRKMIYQASSLRHHCASPCFGGGVLKQEPYALLGGGALALCRMGGWRECR